MRIRVFAPAKINLFLVVGPLDASTKMHPLTSLAAFADVGDRIEATHADALSLRIDGPFADGLDAGEDNLVMRAAQALAKHCGVSAKAALRLEKNLPIASGIGGGSSDAAATLKALRSLWDVNVSNDALRAVAATLGSDVPVCVEAQAALMLGTGVESEPVPAPSLHAVLVNPLRPVSTPAVYRAFDAIGRHDTFDRGFVVQIDSDAILQSIAALGNDLAPAARSLEPAIVEIEALLSAHPAARYVSLSGSGATVFALTDDRAGAESLAAHVSAARPDWWVQPTMLGSVDASPRAR